MTNIYANGCANGDLRSLAQELAQGDVPMPIVLRGPSDGHPVVIGPTPIGVPHGGIRVSQTIDLSPPSPPRRGERSIGTPPMWGSADRGERGCGDEMRG